MFELHHLTALEQLDWLRRGETTPRDLVEHYLSRIERLDAGLGAFVTVTAERALAEASERTTLPTATSLWGLPMADKDLVAREGVPTRYGSRLFRDNVPTASDDLALALDATGAISLGKTNTPEFGMPSYTEPLAAGPARNTLRRKRPAKYAERRVPVTLEFRGSNTESGSKCHQAHLRERWRRLLIG